MKIESIKCPVCNDSIHVDVFDYDTETGLPIPGGFYIHCKEVLLEDNCNRTYDENIVLEAQAFIFIKENKISFKTNAKSNK